MDKEHNVFRMRGIFTEVGRLNDIELAKPEDKRDYRKIVELLQLLVYEYDNIILTLTWPWMKGKGVDLIKKQRADVMEWLECFEKYLGNWRPNFSLTTHGFVKKEENPNE